MLLSLSRVSYEKNIQAVLKALPDVLKEEPNVKLVVAGDGPYLDNLKEQAEDLKIQDSVIFTGMIPPNETALYYKAADFFIILDVVSEKNQGSLLLKGLLELCKRVIGLKTPNCSHLVCSSSS